MAQYTQKFSQKTKVVAQKKNWDRAVFYGLCNYRGFGCVAVGAVVDGVDVLVGLGVGDKKARLLEGYVVPKKDTNRARALLQKKPLLVCLVGSAFFCEVWMFLLGLSCGQTVSYGAVAAALGRPRAARAVGQAVARNPLALVVPCHRVVHSSGKLGQYRWGKRF